MHPWPHRDGAGPGIIERGPRRDAPAVIAVVVAGAAGAIVLAFTLPLALTLAFAAVVGVGGRRGRGHWRHDRSCCGGMEAAVDAVGALHLRARSRTRRHVPRPPSGPAQSP
jgi:hypothetical protein